MITAICQQCNEQFEYELKPGFPRKYCSTCSEIKKQEYANRQTLEVPVVKMGDPDRDLTTAEVQKIMKQCQAALPKPVVRTMPKDPVGLAVEIFCVMKDKSGSMADESIMKHSIDLVKQAQQAFS